MGTRNLCGGAERPSLKITATVVRECSAMHTKKTRMGSLPFTIHNISHHNKKRSPRSFEKEVKVNTYALHTFLQRTLSNCRFAIWALNRRVSKHLIEKKEGSELKEAHTYKVCGVHISRRWLYM